MTITQRRRPTARRTATAVSLALLAGSLAALAPAQAGATAGPRPAPPPASLQRDADALRDAGVTGVSARLRAPDGATHVVRSGVGDLRTGRPVPRDGYVRIGSTTKAYVATVLLQLVGEGRVSLDDTVDRWLPGVVDGRGNDGRKISLRQLLKHTSGLSDYIADVVPDPTARGYYENRSTTYTSEERVAFAMSHPPSFEPGARWEYSNVNYVLAGMVVKAVTGRPWDQEVRSRILSPLGLTRTSTPGDRPYLPKPHARNYQQFEAGGPLADTTLAYLPFDGDADGSMISTTAETDRFFTALLRGKLLAPAQLAEMRRTVPVPDEQGAPPGTRYGLGIQWTPLSCDADGGRGAGGTGGYWGHGGTGFGSVLFPAVTADGRSAVTVSAHSRPGEQNASEGQIRGITDLIDHALCATDGRRTGSRTDVGPDIGRGAVTLP